MFNVDTQRQTKAESNPIQLEATKVIGVRRIQWDIVFDRFGTLLLSIVLALIIWLVAITSDNPVKIAPFPEEIPVIVRGLAADLQPLQDLNIETIKLELKAPQNLLENLEVNDFSAYIDLADLGVGVHDVPVQIELSNPRVQIIEPKEPLLRIHLDKVITKSVPIQVQIMDSTAFGFDWQMPVVEPLSITVKGPATQVNQVTIAEADIYLRNAKSPVESQRHVVLKNAQGQAITLVEAEPNHVQIVVPVERWPGRKEVAVRVNWEGEPGVGYRLDKIKTTPSTVVLLGKSDILNSVPGFIETEPLLLEGTVTAIQQRLNLVLPAGVTAREGDSAIVNVEIAPIESGATVQRQPIIQGLSEGLVAFVALEAVDVIVSGPLPAVESLSKDTLGNDVRILLDLDGFIPGSHIITPKVELPEGVRLKSILPETVEVLVTIEATPIPDSVDPPTSSNRDDMAPTSSVETTE